MRWNRAHPQPAEAPRASERLTIHSERAGRTHIVQPVGELDLDTAPQFEDELKRVEATDTPEIRVDLSRVQSIDRVGLKVFVNASARSRASQGRLRLMRGPDVVQRAFQMTGLESRLPFAD